MILGINYENIKQIEVYKSEPFHSKGDFEVSVVYEVTKTQYIDDGIYRAIDADIMMIVLLSIPEVNL